MRWRGHNNTTTPCTSPLGQKAPFASVCSAPLADLVCMLLAKKPQEETWPAENVNRLVAVPGVAREDPNNGWNRLFRVVDLNSRWKA